MSLGEDLEREEIELETEAKINDKAITSAKTAFWIVFKFALFIFGIMMLQQVFSG